MPELSFQKYKRKVPETRDAEQLFSSLPQSVQDFMAANNVEGFVLVGGLIVMPGDYVVKTKNVQGDDTEQVVRKADFEKTWQPE